MVGLVALAASSSAAAKTVPLSRIPQTKIDRIADLGPLPKRIAAGKKVAGLFPAQPPKRQRGDTPSAFLAPTKALAKTFERDGWANIDETDDSLPCQTVIPGQMLESNAFDEYPSELSQIQHVWAESSQRRRVSVVRSERLVRGEGDAATLEVDVSFVDAVSLGARTVLRQRIALRRVAAGPGGVDVYAARDGDRVQFVVTAARFDEAAARHLTNLRLDSAGDSGWSQCGFIRTTVAAKPEGRAMRVLTMVPLQVETTERRIPGAAQETPAIEVKELRARNTAVHLSVSRTSEDRQPVVSVAFGWDGETERFGL